MEKALLIITCVLLLATVCLCVYGFCDLERISDELANTPGVSGADFFGIGWAHGIELCAVSAVGLAVSITGTLLQRKKAPKIISLIAVIGFVLLIAVSAFLFFR